MKEIFKSLLKEKISTKASIICWEDKNLTYKDLYNAYDQVDLGEIKSGDIVALIGDYDPISIAYLLKLLDKSCIVVPLTKDTISQHEYFFKNAQANWVVENKKIDKVLFGNKKHKLITKLNKKNIPGIILFSSGTSGKPKAILHDFTVFLKRYKDVNKTFVTISFLLFDHIGGLNTFFYALFSGSRLVFPESRDPNYIWKLIQDENVELLPTSPTFLRLSRASVNFDNLNLENLRLITYGTELMELSLLKWYVLKFNKVDFRQTYGLSELGILKIKGKAKDSLFMKIGGKAIVKFQDNTLLIKAENPMLGYLNAPDPFDEEGFYNTKDLIETEGEYFKILARESDLINIGGQKINPLDVENLLLSVDGIKDVLAYGVPNEILGNTMQLDVELDTSSDLNKKDLNKLILENFPAIYRPSKINFIGASKHNHRFKKMRNIEK